MRSGTLSNRSPHPASRAKLVAKGLRLSEAKQADDANDLLPHPKSGWGCEFSSLRHDSISESRDRDYRRLCIFCAGEFDGRNIQIRSLGVAMSPKGESRLRINLYNVEGFRRETGNVLGLLSMKGHMRWLRKSPNTNPIDWKAWGGGAILVGKSSITLSMAGQNDWEQTMGVALD